MDDFNDFNDIAKNNPVEALILLNERLSALVEALEPVQKEDQPQGE